MSYILLYSGAGAAASVTIRPAVLHAYGTIQSPSILINFLLQPSFLGGVGEIQTPAVVTSALVSASLLNAQGVIQAPTLTFGMTISGVIFDAQGVIQTPAVTAGALIAESILNAYGIILEPTIIAGGNVTISAAIQEALAVLLEPTIITPGAVERRVVFLGESRLVLEVRGWSYAETVVRCESGMVNVIEAASRFNRAVNGSSAINGREVRMASRITKQVYGLSQLYEEVA